MICVEVKKVDSEKSEKGKQTVWSDWPDICMTQSTACVARFAEVEYGPYGDVDDTGKSSA